MNSKMHKDGIAHVFLDAPDGTVLKIYSCGEFGLPVLFISNAIGMPWIFVQKFMRYFSEHYQVVTWEPHLSRTDVGLPDIFPPDKLAEYLVQVVVYVGSSSPQYMAAWSTGCEIALRAISNSYLKFQKIVLLSPLLSIAIKTEFESSFIENLRVIVKLISTFELSAERFLAIKNRFKGKSADDMDICESKKLKKSLVSLNFDDANRFSKYMSVMKDFFSVDKVSDFLRCSSRNITFYVGINDEITSVDSVKQYAKISPSLSLYVASEGAHHDLFMSEKVFGDIRLLLKFQSNTEFQHEGTSFETV